MKQCNICNEIKESDQFYGKMTRCKSCHKQWRKKHYKDNSEKVKAQVKQYDSENRENQLARLKKYFDRLRQSEDFINYYYSKEAKKVRSEYIKGRRKNDKLFFLKDRLRGRTRKALHGKRKSKKFHQYIGCTVEFLASHIESKFTDGMSWENKDKWHIDHIIPLSSAKTEEEIYMLCHYTNLQPLWAIDNIKKRDKIG